MKKNKLINFKNYSKQHFELLKKIDGKKVDYLISQIKNKK